MSELGLKLLRSSECLGQIAKRRVSGASNILRHTHTVFEPYHVLVSQTCSCAGSDVPQILLRLYQARRRVTLYDYYHE